MATPTTKTTRRKPASSPTSGPQAQARAHRQAYNRRKTRAKAKSEALQGKSVPGPEPSLELVVTPGPTFAAALEIGAMAGETVYLVGGHTPAGKQPGNGDPPGTLTIHGLIPGATYRVRQFQQPKVLKDFTAEAGKTIDVDVPVQ